MPHYQDGKTLTVYFFKSPSGNEPVRDWLKLRTLEEKKAIGEDIKAVEFLWPVGIRKLSNWTKIYGKSGLIYRMAFAGFFLQSGRGIWFCYIVS
jgi:hypothetical protein